MDYSSVRLSRTKLVQQNRIETQKYNENSRKNLTLFTWNRGYSPASVGQLGSHVLVVQCLNGRRLKIILGSKVS